MKGAWPGVGVAVLVLAIALVLRARTEEQRAPIASRAAEASNPQRPGSEIVLRIAPGVTGAASQPPKASSTQAFSPLMHELARRREYKSIYERLKASTSRTAEEDYVLAEILANCAHVADRRPPRMSGWKLGGEEARTRFIASLGPKDPNREKRIAAFERINVDPCAGFEEVQSSEREIRALLERAAATDAKAKASLLLKDLEGPARDGQYPSVTDAQLATIREVLASGDPRALVDIVRLFGLHLSNFSIRTGDEEAPLEFWAMHGAATLAACELGYPCGPDSRFLLEACALEGQCDAANYRDYWFYYYSSPSTSQRASQYHANLMRGIREGDWSYFTFHRSPPPGYAPFQRR